ncbi:hypothetical protein SK066_18975 [Paenibacillus hunanensis]|uniref:hypothetical protein n=1 Tax=Paenibacillus hunanensis TaxID=539262 RepID=UPI002A6996C2|nr:hypothetical protein [Paenibacillus hunanensis]WPP40658.1 hypothetical protein SK066_18975 [Paenibacillus hunanensis]
MVNGLVWAGLIAMAGAVFLSSSWMGGYVSDVDETAAQERRIRKKQRMRWAMWCLVLSLVMFALALLVYNLR